ncbi:MAG: RsmE family RNA methyltransferase [Bacteroidota bacterium]
MNTNYFYTQPEFINENTLTLINEEFHHCVNVLRKKFGEKIFVVDGIGNCFEAQIIEIQNKIAVGEIITKYENFNEPSVSLTLAVCLLKNSAKFDFMVEKATELGVKKIIPVISEHTIVHHIKKERLEKLALSAMKQCGRGCLPVIADMHSYDELICQKEIAENKLIAYEFEKEKTAMYPTPSAIVLVGPEGGFSIAEVEKGIEEGWNLISLGKRRLRTETAAIALCAKFIDG